MGIGASNPDGTGAPITINKPQRAIAFLARDPLKRINDLQLKAMLPHKSKNLLIFLLLLQVEIIPDQGRQVCWLDGLLAMQRGRGGVALSRIAPLAPRLVVARVSGGMYVLGLGWGGDEAG